MSTRPPLPPFTHETAVLKVRLAEDIGVTLKTSAAPSGTPYSAAGTLARSTTQPGYQTTSRR